jgi:alpha-tubulin suppressor-like RCC1 family protein
VGLSSGVIAVAAGNASTCAVTAAGGVKCWGNGLRPGGDVPVDVPGLSPGVVAVALGTATGDEQACAVDSAGAALCWGSDVEGQLGDGTTTNGQVPAPVGVAGLSSGVVGISAGDSYTCAVTSAGTVECWGANVGVFTGATGRGSDVPVDIGGVSSGARAVSAGGGGHACVVTVAGAAQCWGANGAGQLGDDSTTSRLVPADVVGLSSGVLAISAGNGYTCALTVGGAVECWGTNDSGTLGDGSRIQSLVPVEVVGL